MPLEPFLLRESSFDGFATSSRILVVAVADHIDDPDRWLGQRFAIDLVPLGGVPLLSRRVDDHKGSLVEYHLSAVDRLRARGGRDRLDESGSNLEGIQE